MGAAQSKVEAVHFATTQQPRNKLTKPRTNSNTTREATCLPSLPLSLPRFSLSGNPRPSPAVQYQTIGDQPHWGIHAIEYSNTISPNDVRQPKVWASTGDHGSELPAYFDSPSLNSLLGVDSAFPCVVSAMPVSTGMRRGSMITRSSTNSSAPLPNPNSEIPSMSTVRRRSQLLAAPPATATRKPVKSHKQNESLSITLVSPDPYSLAPQPDNDAGRCTTPSGYSVLGAFKRGSLRIANGAASPAPSSSRASPELSLRAGYFGTNLALPQAQSNRPTSKGKPLVVITDSIIPTHEVRLVPPSPTDWRDEDEDRVPGSPFSFIRSPSIYSEDTTDSSLEFDPPANDTLESLRLPIYGPTDSLESLISTSSSNSSIGYEYHKILTEQCLNWDSDKPVRVDVEMSKMFASAPCIETDEYHKILFREAQKENGRRLRRPSITKIGGEGTDSGYSSSGSINSWKTAWSEQYAEPNQVACKLEDPDVTMKDAPVVSSAGGEVVCIAGEPMSRRRSVVAAIRRRYSQGDLKAFARSNEGTKQPPIPTMPVIERQKSVWKPLPVLKHRRSMTTITKSPVPQTGLPETSSVIQPAPPLPCTKLEQKISLNILTVEDYLSLVGDFPLTPTIDDVTNTANLSFINTSRNIQDSVVKMGAGRSLDRGSKITGQDYYQRFSR